jgi:hypothetical protein
MTLTSFALMSLLILVRSVLTLLFGRFGKAIPPPPYLVFEFKAALKLHLYAALQKTYFSSTPFWDSGL